MKQEVVVERTAPPVYIAPDAGFVGGNFRRDVRDHRPANHVNAPGRRNWFCLDQLTGSTESGSGNLAGSFADYRLFLSLNRNDVRLSD
jgi:hypothetical protein